MSIIVITICLLLSKSYATTCKVIDVSSTSNNNTTTLISAQTQARHLLTTNNCVTVNLTGRTFRTQLELTALDSHTRWLGGEFTDAIDLPIEAWQQQQTNTNHQHQYQREFHLNNLNVTRLNLGDSLTTNHVQLLIQLPTNRWHPLIFARWPNIPFHGSTPPATATQTEIETPPTNWTTVGAVPSDPNCLLKSQCPTFQWSNQTHRPTRWVQAATQGRLYLQGLFKYMWRDNRVQINHVSCKNNSLMTDSVTIGTAGVYPGSLYYAYGMSFIEELDVPGEFVINVTTMVLSAILPPICFDANDTMVCPMKLVKVKKSNKIPPSNLISITNAHDIVLSNVTIQGSSRQVR